LKDLFGRVLVPTSVWKEATAHRSLPGASSVLQADWLEVVSAPLVKTRPEFSGLALHDGERDGLELALELSADLFLSDDQDAVRAARAVEVPVLGSVGVLIRAKDKGLIEAVLPQLIAMQSQGFWMSKRFVGTVARLVNESAPGEQ
jgi:predicted nucleic acid-binding protein